MRLALLLLVLAMHIHELNFPPLTGEHIVDDIAAGPDKIGSIPLEPGDVLALRAQMMFVLVHTGDDRGPACIPAAGPLSLRLTS